jgi:hypothetical protein
MVTIARKKTGEKTKRLATNEILQALPPPSGTYRFDLLLSNRKFPNLCGAPSSSKRTIATKLSTSTTTISPPARAPVRVNNVGRLDAGVGRGLPATQDGVAQRINC